MTSKVADSLKVVVAVVGDAWERTKKKRRVMNSGNGGSDLGNPRGSIVMSVASRHCLRFTFSTPCMSRQ
jgi:hypothetical protein